MVVRIITTEKTEAGKRKKKCQYGWNGNFKQDE
jgi:hypothetical protein